MGKQDVHLQEKRLNFLFRLLKLEVFTVFASLSFFIALKWFATLWLSIQN